MALPTDEDPDPKFVALYEGVVVDNKDPKVAGRVKFMIPGVLEPASAWALPVGASSSESSGAGFYNVPKVGADVTVFFKEGDVDAPRYMIGSWGAPKGKGDVPRSARDVAPEDADKVKVIQSDRWEVVLDERPGKASVRIKDLDFEEDVIEIDGEAHGVRVSGTAAVLIESRGIIRLNALQIVLNGRLVRESGDDI